MQAQWRFRLTQGACKFVKLARLDQTGSDCWWPGLLHERNEQKENLSDKGCWKVPLVAGLWLKHIEAHPWLSMLQLFSAQEFLCECMVIIINTCPSNLKRYGQFEVLLASFIQNHELEQRWKQLQSWSDTSASKNQRRKSKEVVRARHHGSLASLWSLPMAPLPGGPWGTEWWRWRTCKSDQAIFDTASSGEGTYNPLERFGKYLKVKTSQDMSRLPFYLEFNMAATWQSYDVATCWVCRGVCRESEWVCKKGNIC